MKSPATKHPSLELFKLEASREMGSMLLLAWRLVMFLMTGMKSLATSSSKLSVMKANKNQFNKKSRKIFKRISMSIKRTKRKKQIKKINKLNKNNKRKANPKKIIKRKMIPRKSKHLHQFYQSQNWLEWCKKFKATKRAMRKWKRKPRKKNKIQKSK